MSTSKLIHSVLGSSILRSHKTLTQAGPVWFTNKLPFLTPSLRFNRCNFSSSAALLDSADANLTPGSTQPSVLPPPQLSSHPWPEWVDFVNRLKSKGYFSESLTASAAAPPPSAAESGGDEDGAGAVYTDVNLLKHACLNFARDRFDIFKSLSMQDIQTIVEKGCPNLFRKVVNSAKRLRVHLQLDEGDVCSTCNLRGSCDRAYTILKDSEASARTLDIVRVLLHYALDAAVISGGRMSPGREDIEASARKLLSELIELSETVPDPELLKASLPKPAAKASRPKKEAINFVDDESYRNVEMKRGDWMCPECNFMNFARNIRCLKCKAEGPKRVSNDVEMKKGDWNCPECNFMNFARNIRCLKCKAEGPNRVSNDVEMKEGDWNCLECGFMNFASKTKCFRCREPRPKRQLNPGEWECPSCDFLNYRRNTVCKKCNCDRPVDGNTPYEQQIWKRPFSNEF